MSSALYVGVVAQFTGWSEDYIRWHLPLARGWSYFHAARMLAGEKRVWAKPSRDDLAFEDRVDSFLDKFRRDP